MPLSPTWIDIAIRLALTMLAGAIIGFNRGARGHAAGFRTTILVGLAAAIAMILTNVLLSTGGKTSNSFATMDPMRLPLGILTGVGFIGGGTILRKGDLVTGVTTAATLWLMTVIGLCLGAGELGLGVIGTLLAGFTLWMLKWVDLAIPREHRARLVVTSEPSWTLVGELPRLIQPTGTSPSSPSNSRPTTDDSGGSRGAAQDEAALIACSSAALVCDTMSSTRSSRLTLAAFPVSSPCSASMMTPCSAAQICRA